MKIDLYDLRRREVQALGAALSCRNWQMMETAYNSLRDKLDNAGFSIGARPPAVLASLPPATDPAMVTVPREPTDAMLDAYWHATGESKEMRPRVHAYMRRYYAAMIAAAPITPATGEAVKEGERPYPELLSGDEQRDLLTRAEEMWRDLQANNLGGYSGANRPFWIVHELRRVIEQYGHRDTGLKWSKDDLDAHSKATIPATGHAATEGEGA